MMSCSNTSCTSVHYSLCSFSYYACVQVQLAAKTSILSLFCRGLSRLKGMLFEDEYRGAEDRTELQGYIGEPLARSMVDTLNEGRKYCLPVYNSH